MIKAVIFDFDGTIVDTETLWFTITKEILIRDYHVNLPLEEFAKCIGTTDEVLYEYMEQQLGVPVDRVEIETKVGKKFQSLKDVLILREGVLELIHGMKDRGWMLGVASSSSRDWVESYLKKFQIRHHFQVIKTKEDVEKVKPAPDLYIKAMETLGVGPEEAIAIEDSVNGSRAAIEAGMKCVVVPNDVTNFLTFHEKAVRYKMFSEIIIDELEI
jgi:putative hydrolase of the HAD superfamily